MANVEDRWTRVGPSGRRIRTERYGQGKRWRARWQGAGGRHARSFATKEAALAHLMSIVGPHSPADVTLAEFAAAWQAAQIHQRPATRQQMESRWRLHILPELGDQKLDSITRADVQAAVVAWSENLAPSTVQVTYGYLASALRAAADDGLIPITPCRRINLPPMPRERITPLTAAQVHHIAEAVPRRYRAMVLLAAATGMRQGEFRGLTWDRVGFGDDGAVIRVDRQLVDSRPTWGPPKTAKSDRSIPVGPDEARMLREHLARHAPHPSGLIFTGRTGVPIGRGSMSKIWHTATDGMALRRRSGWHDLRHFHASMLIAGGMSVIAVAERLGHQDTTETLQTYGHLWHDDQSRMLGVIAGTLWATEPPANPRLSIVPGGRGA